MKIAAVNLALVLTAASTASVRAADVAFFESKIRPLLVEHCYECHGEKKEESVEKDERYQVVERSFGAFERSFTLPRAVDAAKITASFEDGLLVVRMPKTTESHGRKIAISG